MISVNSSCPWGGTVYSRSPAPMRRIQNSSFVILMPVQMIMMVVRVRARMPPAFSAFSASPDGWPVCMIVSPVVHPRATNSPTATTRDFRRGSSRCSLASSQRPSSRVGVKSSLLGFSRVMLFILGFSSRVGGPVHCAGSCWACVWGREAGPELYRQPLAPSCCTVMLHRVRLIPLGEGPP